MALARPHHPLARPGLSAKGQHQLLRHTPLLLSPLRRIPISLELQLKTQAKLSLLGWYIIKRVRFSQREEKRQGTWQLPGARQGLPGPGFSTARDPTLAQIPDLGPTAALREASATDAPRVLSFCFHSLLSAAWKIAKEQSGGEKRVSRPSGNTHGLAGSGAG